jgi:DNA polymerase III delta subunit
MISILHGDHEVASRNRLVELKRLAKSDGKEVRELDGNSIDLTDIIQSLESRSLFAPLHLVVVENLLGNLRPGKKRDEIIAYLSKGNFDTDAILWEKKGVGRQLIKLKRQKQVTVEEFKLPTVIFSFVDGLMPNNYRNLLQTFHDTITNNVVPEVVFTMIVRQFRLLLAVTLNSTIPEAKRLAPWQRGKLERQARFFSLDTLKKQYKNLLTIDYQIKTGKSALNLTKRIEQFIIGL